MTVLAFPGGYNPRSVESMAIEFAAKVKGGYYGTVGFACILFETPDGLGMLTAGADETNGYRLIGMLEAGKMSVFADADDD